MTSDQVKSRRLGRMLRGALIVIAVLLAIDAVVWRVATGQMRAAYLAWQAGLPAQGWQVDAGPPAAGGWPIAATLRLRDVRAAQRAPGGAAWTSQRVSFGVSLLHPRLLTIRPRGAQVLTLPGLTPLRFQPGRFLAMLQLGAPVQAVRASTTGAVVELRAGPLAIDHLEMQAAWQPDAVHVRAAAGPASLPANHRWGLGRTIEAASIDLVMHGGWPGGAAAPAASHWRDAGGHLDVSAVALRWGALDVTGSGRAGIGADGQPAATLDARVVNPDAALEALADAGAINRNAATAAGAVLSLLEVPARLTNQPDVLNLPLRLDAGTVSLGQIPVARLPRVDW